MKRPSARDIALSANGRNLLRRPEKEPAVAVANVRRRHLRHRLRHRHLNHHHMQNGVWNRRRNRRSTGRVKEAKGPQAADSSSNGGSSSSESSTDTEMSLVDVCTILCGSSERVTGKLVAVAEGREGGRQLLI